MKPLCRARPQHHIRHCEDCGGEGRTVDCDWDDEGQPFSVTVTCEGCDGSGEVADCDECDCTRPVTELESLGYICGDCRADLEMGAMRRRSA